MEYIDELLECSRYGELDDITAFVRDTQISRGLSIDDKVDFLSAQGKRGNTMLHMAAANGHLDLVNYLISNCTTPVADFVNCANEEGNTALHWACMNAHVSVVEVLLQHGADGKLRNKAGQTCLFYAQNNDHESVVSKLLELVDYETEANDEVELEEQVVDR